MGGARDGLEGVRILTQSFYLVLRRLFLIAPLAISALLLPNAAAQVSVQGQWSTASYQIPINPIHSALLNNGKILVVAGSGNCIPTVSGCPQSAPYGPANGAGAVLVDPSTGNITHFTVSWDMFCNGMLVLPDGRVFINGGTQDWNPNFTGSVRSSLFDPNTNTFTDVQDMAHGRWYPTVLNLPDGRVMTFSGIDENNVTNSTVEIFTPGTGWSPQYGAGFTPPLYPRLHLLPSGKVFFSGSDITTLLFNPADQTWTTVGDRVWNGQRVYGSSVMLPLTPANNYDPQIITMGGNMYSPTATTEIIDMGAANPAWQLGPNMSQPRVEMNAVILPNQKVLVLGGSSQDEVANTASLNADLYDPASNSFSSAGNNTIPRLYHSMAMLLPDATVWVAGSNPDYNVYEPRVEIYKPAYLFNSNGTAATQPTLSSIPGNIAWGAGFTVSTPDAASISSVLLIRPGAPTHAFDTEQRVVGMSFTKGSGTLTVTAPPNANIAPPGYYMLFLVNSSGVPSVAKFTKLGSTTGNPAPTLNSISPTSGSANGGTPVTITGTGFASGATVSLGGTAATGVTVVSSTTITATTAAHAAGAVNVVVTNPDAQSDTLTNGYTYTAVNPAPTVSSISPAAGTVNGGTPISIVGTGFIAGATATLGGSAATGITVVSSTLITATSPAHSAGAVAVVVTNPDTQSGSKLNGFTYTAPSPAPTVSAINPISGSSTGGTSVIITGTGFLTGATVSLGGTAATGSTVNSSTSLTAVTAAHAAGVVNVVVTNSDSQSGSLTSGYTYTSVSSSLGLSVPAGDSSSATVVAGQAAAYTLSIGGAGMSGTATLTCSGAPSQANCSVPATEAFSSTTPVTFNISVTTTARTAGAMRPPTFAPVTWSWAFAMIGIVVLPGISVRKRSLLRSFRLLPLAFLLLLISCGGGGTGTQPANPNPSPNPNGTPAGTYTLTVQATSGTSTQTVPLTLTVAINRFQVLERLSRVKQIKLLRSAQINEAQASAPWAELAEEV